MSKPCDWCTREDQETCPECEGTGVVDDTQVNAMATPDAPQSEPASPIRQEPSEVLDEWLDNAMSTSSIAWSPIDGYHHHEEKSEEEAEKDFDRYKTKAVAALEHWKNTQVVAALDNIKLPGKFKGLDKAYKSGKIDWTTLQSCRSFNDVIDAVATAIQRQKERYKS